MILSNNKDALFFSVTKTGSTTARSLLAPYGVAIGKWGDHIARDGLHSCYREKYPDATVEEMDAIQGYAFWRDPVDRFKSSLGYMRQYPIALLQLFPDIFGPGAPYDLEQVNLPKRFTNQNFGNLPRVIRNKIGDFLNDGEILRRLYQGVEANIITNIVFAPQHKWLAYPNMTILNFHDYENEVRRLVGIFGGPTNITVPALNTAADFLPPINIPPEIEEWVQLVYTDDYAFDPR